jgi:hypothetical protein
VRKHAKNNRKRTPYPGFAPKQRRKQSLIIDDAPKGRNAHVDDFAENTVSLCSLHMRPPFGVHPGLLLVADISMKDISPAPFQIEQENKPVHTTR